METVTNQEVTKEIKIWKKKNTIEAEEPLLLTFTQIECKCYCCGKSGQRLPQCRFKDSKPKSELFINAVQLTETSNAIPNKNDFSTSTTKNSSEYNSNSTITSKKIGWSNLHYNLSNCNSQQKNIMQDLVLLDSNSTTTIFCN